MSELQVNDNQANRGGEVNVAANGKVSGEDSREEKDQADQSNTAANHFSMQVKNQFLPAVGHPLQSNWQFWFYQRQPSVHGQGGPMKSHPANENEG